MTRCSECAVRDRAICQSLCEADLEELSRLGRHQTLEKGQALLWEGDESLLVGNVVDGVLKLCSTTSAGRDQTLGTFYPSDFLGRPFASTTPHSVIAVTDARVCTFTRSAFDGFARKHPDLEHKLLQRTLSELDRARRWMLLLGSKSATERVSAFLLDLASRLPAEPVDQGSDGAIRLELPFGRQEIADLLGLTIETVSRQITQLKHDRIIDTPSRRAIVILDRAGLEACAGEL
ncbi:MAG: Crp/Fnr family transcriptional regulator [Novosphingobium sp.]|nr:Crp/Fnr family transcriptional regulator [Novosphingobium sp.]